MLRIFALVTFVAALLVIAYTAAHASTNNFHKYGSMEALYDAIDDKKFEDDSINWKDFKDWNWYKTASDDLKDCIKHRQDLSSNLADYEVYNCYEEEEEHDD